MTILIVTSFTIVLRWFLINDMIEPSFSHSPWLNQNWTVIKTVNICWHISTSIPIHWHPPSTIIEKIMKPLSKTIIHHANHHWKLKPSLRLSVNPYKPSLASRLITLPDVRSPVAGANFTELIALLCPEQIAAVVAVLQCSVGDLPVCWLGLVHEGYQPRNIDLVPERILTNLMGGHHFVERTCTP